MIVIKYGRDLEFFCNGGIFLLNNYPLIGNRLNSLDSLRLYSYNYSNVANLRKPNAKAENKTNMRKKTIELTEEQYFFLKEKALEIQKRNQNGTIVSIIRDLIKKDR